MSPWALNRIVSAISRGAVFGYPTDTIWGLGCHPRNPSSIDRILQIKGRKAKKGLILLSSSLDYCLDYIDAREAELEKLRHPLERPTTWLVKASRDCPGWLTGQHPTVAIRITRHPLIQTLSDSLQSPLISTSANRSGRSNVRNRIQMQKQFANELDIIIGGFETGGYRASDIKFLDSGDQIR